MRALVLAAGRGRRLSNGDGPKALVRLLGLPLITRVILTARQAGIRDFTVVVGYQAQVVMESLGDGSSLGIKLAYVQNEAWERGNGLSVLKGAQQFDEERFLLLMADHVLKPEIVAKLSRSRVQGGVAMAVDTSPGEEKVAEATKVFVENRRVRRVGKGLATFTGVDMGVMAGGKELARALQAAIDEGREELGDALDQLARDGKVRAVEFKGPLWADLDTPRDFRRARKDMLRDLGKSEDGPVARYLNRPLSTRLSALLVKTRLTPNQMSIFVLGLAFLASYFLFLGIYPFLLVGGILIQLSSILDGSDGEIARLKFVSTQKGGWLDSVADRYADFIFISALAYGQWALAPDLRWGFLAIFAIVGSFGVSYTSAAYFASFKRGHPLGLQLPAKRDSRLLILAAAAVIGLPLYGLLAVGVLGNAEVIRRLLTWR